MEDSWGTNSTIANLQKLANSHPLFPLDRQPSLSIPSPFCVFSLPSIHVTSDLNPPFKIKVQS